MKKKIRLKNIFNLKHFLINFYIPNFLINKKIFSFLILNLIIPNGQIKKKYITACPTYLIQSSISIKIKETQLQIVYQIPKEKLLIKYIKNKLLIKKI